MKVIENILAYLFGTKYYLVVVNRRGLGLCEVSSRIHRTKASAEHERLKIQSCISLLPIDIVSFRTKKNVPQVYEDLSLNQAKEMNV